MEKTRPDWLMSVIAVSLIGNVTPHLRAVAARYDARKHLTLRFYFTPEAGEGDFDAQDEFETALESSEATHRMKDIHVDRVISADPIGKLDYLDYFVFARHE